MLDGVTWDTQRFTLNGFSFALEEAHQGNREYADDCFMLYKNVRQLEQYGRFWKTKPEFRPRTILELGMWDGGSVALWSEYFHPQRLVAIDIDGRGDSPYVQQYIKARGLQSRIKTFWNIDQADRRRLQAIVDGELGGAVDLVIDDASHLYDFTKRSFEILFPRLNPGGLYIIEDWSWACWPTLPVPFLPVGQELPELIHEIVSAAGSTERAFAPGAGRIPHYPIANVAIYPDFVVVERGDGDLPADFELSSFITSSPQLQQAREEKLGKLRARSS